MALFKKEAEIEEAEEAAKEAEETGKVAADFKDPYDVGPRPDENGKPLRQWKKRVRKARKILRKDLKKRGIKKRAEFEQVAWEMGLSLDEDRKFFPFLWLPGWLASHFGLGALFAAAGALLASIFLLSYITDHAGAFTVNLTGELLRAGFLLCDEPEFKNPSSRLRSEETKNINNITISDISENVNEIDGSHNGANYVAYTFYIKNDGAITGDYRYALKIGSSSLGVNDAVWFMLFEDGHQVVYANTSADGDAEKLAGYSSEPPFYDMAYNASEQYYKTGKEWGIKTTPFADEDTIVYGKMEDVAPQEVHKYTVVIWLEGYDPECVDDIFGGHGTYSMEFTIEDKMGDKSIFSGVWRTEYDDYADYVAGNIGGSEEETTPAE